MNFDANINFNEDTAFNADLEKNSIDGNSTNIESDDKNYTKTSKFNLYFKPNDIVQGIIYSEILGKPRAFSRFGFGRRI